MFLSDQPTVQRDIPERVRAMSVRLAEIKMTLNAKTPRSDLLKSDLLKNALDELDRYVEALGVGEEALRLQNEVLEAVALSRDAERRRYEGLFSSVPDALLVTDAEGLIWEANPAAAKTLNLTRYHLIRRSVLSFVSSEAREDFKQRMVVGGHSGAVQTRWPMSQARGGHSFKARVSVMPICNEFGALELHWLIHPDGQED